MQTLRNRLEELKSAGRRSIAVHPANVGSSVSAPLLPSFHSLSPPSSLILSSPPIMTTPPMAPLVMSPPPQASPIMSPLSPYLAAILTSSPLFSLPSPSTSPPISYPIIPPAITPAGELLDTSSPLLSLPSPSTSPPITYSVIPPAITPAGELLDTEKPAFIIFWNQVNPNLRNEVQSLN